MMDHNGPFIHVIGVDVGGTKIAGGIVSLPAGEILYRLEQPTLASRGGSAVLDEARALVGRLASEGISRGVKVSAIGLGVPELVGLDGRVTSAHNFDWRDIELAHAFGGLPATVDADVRAAALAEATHGAGRARHSFLYVTIGTGISCCLVLGGNPLAGARGNALAFASGAMRRTCGQCGAEETRVLEEYASGPALAARYNAAGGAAATRAEDVLTAACSGDDLASDVVVSGAVELGGQVGLLVNALDPEAVVVGGGLGSADGVYWDHFVESTRRQIWSCESARLPIEHAGLGPAAGIVGAALRAGECLR